MRSACRARIAGAVDMIDPYLLNIATALTDRVLSAVGGLRPLSLPVGAASVKLRSLPVERVNFLGAGVAKQER